MTAHSAPDRPDRGDRGDRGGDKRERILLAAERIFARHGFFAARVSEIAKEAGVADGTIYLYFKSKDDLLVSLFEDRIMLLLSTLERELLRVDVEDTLKADDIFDRLMGSDVAPRKRFIQTHAKSVRNLDI